MTCWANIGKLLRSLQQKPIKCNSRAFFPPIISSFHTKIVPLHSQTSSELFAILIKLNENHFSTGEVLEWLKRHAWKACKRLKRFGGSNPPLSAKWLQDDFKMVVKKAFKISVNRCKTYTYNDFSLYISLYSDG